MGLMVFCTPDGENGAQGEAEGAICSQGCTQIHRVATMEDFWDKSGRPNSGLFPLFSSLRTIEKDR